METLSHPTNLDPIDFSKKCSSLNNVPTPTPNSEDVHQFLPEYSGVYYRSKGDRHCGKLTDHYILFENDTLFVDGDNRGSVFHPANQLFLERLRNFEVPDEFPEDGTHQIFVEKKGKELAMFDAEYFEKMRELNALGSGDEYDDYDVNDSDDEDVCIKMFGHRIEFKDNLLFVDGKSRGSVDDSRHAWFLETVENYELPGEFYGEVIHVVSVAKIGDTRPPQFNRKYFMEMREMYSLELGCGDFGESPGEEP